MRSMRSMRWVRGIIKQVIDRAHGSWQVIAGYEHGARTESRQGHDCGHADGAHRDW
jgi:hypothetical protein